MKYFRLYLHPDGVLPRCSKFFCYNIHFLCDTRLSWHDFFVGINFSFQIPCEHRQLTGDKSVFTLLIVDWSLFALVSYSGYQYPDLRFIGMTICDAVTLALIIMIIRANVNRKLSGDDLMPFDNTTKAYCLYDAIIGGLLAILFSPSIELCLFLQVLAMTLSHIVEYVGVKKIS